MRKWVYFALLAMLTAFCGCRTSGVLESEVGLIVAQLRGIDASDYIIPCWQGEDRGPTKCTGRVHDFSIAAYEAEQRRIIIAILSGD